MKQQLSMILTELIGYARLAPSVHNTQPWQFKIEDSTLSLFVNPERTLTAGDPTHRELWISLGVCFETLIQACHGLGLEITDQSIQTGSIDGEIAHIRLGTPGDKEQDILDRLKKRVSYRGHMKPASIPKTLSDDMTRKLIADLSGISIVVVGDRTIISKVADLTYQGMSLALSSPEFRKELADLINYNWSPSHIGMHGFVLNRGLLGSVWEKWSINHGIDIKRKANADQEKVLESSGLVFVVAKGDVPHFWFDSGRAYMRIALEITESGLAQSTIAAPVEAASFHEDIEKMLQTTGRIQAMLRIGEAVSTQRRKSPRLSIEELLST
jgi:hypothetical protein